MELSQIKEEIRAWSKEVLEDSQENHPVCPYANKTWQNNSVKIIKSDDMQGRNETLNAIVKGQPIPRPGTPESFKVLMRELQALCLDIAAYSISDQNAGLADTEVNLMDDSDDINENYLLKTNNVVSQGETREG